MTFDASRAIRLGVPSREFAATRPVRTETSFLDTLKDSLNEVAKLDQTADKHVQALAAGNPSDPHEIMMAVEQANMALDLLIEIRNRLMETYQELTRTQI